MSRLNESEVIDLEAQLVNGKRDLVAKRLFELKLEQLPRSLVWKVANLLNRCGHSRNAVKLLRPIVVQNNLTMKPTDSEYLEYALALTLIGATIESLGRFEDFKGPKDYKFHFYYGVTLITRWRYEEAIDHFKKVLVAPMASDYQKSVAKTNLAAALIFIGQLKEAREIILRVEENAKSKNQKLVFGYCHELRAQIEFLNHNYSVALEILKKGREFVEAGPANYQITNQKWDILSRLALSPTSQEIQFELKELRRKAVTTEWWETVRECDLYLATATKDVELLTKVYFGTPYTHYRQRILQRYGTEIRIPEYYDWSPAPLKTNEKMRVLDLNSGRENDVDNDESLIKQRQLYNLLLCLTSDFYQPHKVEQLFSILFEGQYYDPSSSDRRVYANVNRLRNWFLEKNIPVFIKRKTFGYRLYFKEQFAIRKWVDTEEVNANALIEAILQIPEIAIGVPISTIMKKVNVPRASLQRRLSELVYSGYLEKTGSGRSTLYRKPKSKGA